MNILLISHIVAFSLSIGLISSALVGVLIRKEWSVKLAQSSVITGVFGTGLGFILLGSHILSPMCIVLVSYLAALMGLYKYVFHFGDIKAISWLREGTRS